MYFPLPYLPKHNYRGGRGFGADRSAVAKKLGIPGNVLRHGAVDLIAPPGTPVLAMDDGEVLCNPYKFFFDTYAIEVQHTNFIARYCEIARQTEVRKHDIVKAGQVIGYVGNQPGGDMLHLELFSGSKTGPLTTPRTKANQPYYRRADLIDPTPVLDGLVGGVKCNLSTGFKVQTGPDGRKTVAVQRDTRIDI